MAAVKPSSKGQAWFCTTGLPSDVVIEVEEMSFHLHKFPLMARSKKLHQLIREQEQDPGGSSRRRREVKAAALLAARPGAGGEERGAHGEEEVDEEGTVVVVVVEEEKDEEVEEEIEEEEPYHVALPGFPGGADTFEAAAKFCYGVKVELTPWNVAPLRCAAEYLEMTEEFCEDNLVSRCERFLGQSTLRSLKDAVKALKSCEHLMPLAESLGIPQRCLDTIALRASSVDPSSSSLFGWPMNERTAGVLPHQPPALWNGIDTGLRRKHHAGTNARSAEAPAPWFDDLAVLALPLFKRAIAAIKARGLSPEAIEGCLISYAKRSIPGLSRSTRKSSSGGPLPSEAEQRELLDTVIGNLPMEKTGAASTRLLSGLLRTVNILRASEASRETLERKIASQLDRASLDDLLMPSYSYLVDTLYDVDCVERILGHFLDGLQEAAAPAAIAVAEDDDDDVETQGGLARSPPSVRPLMMVAKLVDGYLSEVASDANLKPDKFCDLALALPDHARVYDDGLYRAVDVYLKAHPRMTELEREKVCGVMDYQKLTLEACTHAAQNERLPLRAIVQVLFFEQLQLRHAIAGSLLGADAAGSGSQPPESARGGSGFYDEAVHPAGATREGETWRSAVRDNQVLRLDMDSMRSRVNELERECTSMKKALEKMDRGGGGERGVAHGDARGNGWNSFTRKFGCKFKAQVCDSQERTVVESRRSRAEMTIDQPPPPLQLQLQLEQSL
uniref:BTB/POZ domain-containing protein At5g66560 n=1 Tax=Anthurium amnicola TaxID=1678845 RepID=A0A1D1YBM7_9ARAE